MADRLEKLLARLPAWEWLHMMVVFPYFLLTLKASIAKRREADKKVRQYLGIMNNATTPEDVYKAGMAAINETPRAKAHGIFPQTSSA